MTRAGVEARGATGRGRGDLKGTGRAAGERVLLKAYALDEVGDEAWTRHEEEFDRWLQAPRHEALAAPRALVTAAWRPVAEGTAPMLYLEFPSVARRRRPCSTRVVVACASTRVEGRTLLGVPRS